MLGNSEGQAAPTPALVATVAVATSDALWKRGELSSSNYLAATSLAARVYCGSVGMEEGIAALRDIWMGPEVLLASD